MSGRYKVDLYDYLCKHLHPINEENLHRKNSIRLDIE